MRLPTIAALLIAFPALAQTPPPTADGKKWEPAPTGGPVSDNVAPADRAGGRGGRDADAGPANSTPFSSVPGPASGEQTSPASRDTPGSTEAGTPSLSR